MNIGLTLIGQSITFIVFVWFCMKFIWPPLKDMMRERQEAIAAGLSAAEEADKKLAEAATGAEAELAKAREEAAGIIEQARQRANQMVVDAKTVAREEGERLIEAAKAEIDQESNRAKEALRTQVSALVISGAEKVLESSVDASKHNELLDKLAAEL
ncbi:MAG: F0F1 ATP synthase subunit B [Pseudomonadales bacterium]|jgi:F-type H+-transporting ATPase subunit b|nr:F0F1 ATP synthase subunit B [Pseudomonadales bacterium]